MTKKVRPREVGVMGLATAGDDHGLPFARGCGAACPAEPDGMGLQARAQGLILLDGTSRIVFANAVAKALLRTDSGLVVVAGRLGTPDRNAAQRLQGLVAAAASPRPDARQGGLVAVSTPARRLPLLLAVVPLPPGGLPMFGDGHLAMASITDPDIGARPPDAQLAELFGMTAAEVRVAHGLLDGQTLQEIARDFGLSIHTVRSHVTRIFGKTGVRRQAELVRLLAQLPVAVPSPWLVSAGGAGLPGGDGRLHSPP